MEENNFATWYKESKEKRLEQDIKRCKAFSITSGVVASLSALVVAGNIVAGNGLEALQVGGSTAAMFGYLMCYSQMESIHKKELAESKEKQPTPKNFIKDRLETLKYQLEICDTQLNMAYLVSGSFYASTLGHILELLSMPSAPEIASCITGAALSALVATLYLKLIKSHKITKECRKAEIDGLEEMQKLEEMSKEPIPELIEGQGTLALEAPKEEEQPKILVLEDIPKQTK